jgi:hypothetical protein
MRPLLVLTLVLGLNGAAAAYDLGRQAPAKSPVSCPENIPAPVRQGGDTIATALLIPSLPYNDTGTTAGFTNDYDEVCPFTGSTAPDVVYRYVSPWPQVVSIDLCGSSYDTKVYVYDGGLNLIACNDDYYYSAPCGVYVSNLQCVLLAPGTCYFVIDGYAGASGAYIMEVDPFVGCGLGCPVDALMEGEPALVNEYVDNYNGGCNTGPGFPFQTIYPTNYGEGTSVVCGESGWYYTQGGESRDTDWYILFCGLGVIDVVADAEGATYIAELGPQDCATVSIIQQATAGPCAQAAMSITGYQLEDPVWFWVAPTVFTPSPCVGTTYDYVLWFSGLSQVVATEATTWGSLKALFK